MTENAGDIRLELPHLSTEDEVIRSVLAPDDISALEAILAIRPYLIDPVVRMTAHCVTLPGSGDQPLLRDAVSAAVAGWHGSWRDAQGVQPASAFLHGLVSVAPVLFSFRVLLATGRHTTLWDPLEQSLLDGIHRTGARYLLLARRAQQFPDQASQVLAGRILTMPTVSIFMQGR